MTTMNPLLVLILSMPARGLLLTLRPSFSSRSFVSETATATFSSSSSSSSSGNPFPSPEAIRKAPFMSQVKLGGRVIPLLNTPAPPGVEETLNAMMSSSDGIRGFFVAFLTGPEPPLPVPPVLSVAMMNVDDPNDLIDLSIMNVVMPTAMSATYRAAAKEGGETDAMEGSNTSMAKTSEVTAEKGMLVLEELMRFAEGDPRFGRVVDQVSKVLRVAEGGDDEFWTAFFEKWGYEEPQRRAIRECIKAIKT